MVWRPNVEDGPVAAVLVLIAIGTVVALLFVSDHDAVMKAAGGTVVLLGSYFAARTLKQTRADQRATRILKAIEMSADSREPVQVGAIWTLVDLARSSEARRERDQVKTILAVIDAIDPLPAAFWRDPRSKSAVDNLRGDARERSARTTTD